MILTGQEARQKLVSGATQLANAVKSTLGPKGRNVILDKELGNPVITKDGVSVARDVNLTDEIEQIGAKIIKEVSSRTSRLVGDGTSTSTLLAEQLLLPSIDTKSPVGLKKELDTACDKVIKRIEEITVEVDSEDQLRQIAAISSNGDEEIGEIISESLRLAGESGVITIEQSANHETFIESKSGFEFDKGFMSPYFINNEAATAEYENAYVFLCKESIRTQKEFMPILEKITQLDAPCIIIAKDIEGKPLNVLVYNHIQDRFSGGVVAVKAPEFGDRQVALLHDLAAVTNGEVLSFDKGDTFKNFSKDKFGKVDKVIVSKDGTILINENRNENVLKLREEQVKQQLEQTTSDYDREKLQNRLAKLSGGIVVVYVGAGSEVELREKKARVEDAMHATRAAMEEGIVPGGGVTLFRCREVIREDLTDGAKLLYQVLETPLRTIISNAGEDPDEIIDTLSKSDKIDDGWNALTEKYESFYETGVIDPVKVTKHALKNAVSVAGTFLTTDVVVTQPVNRLEQNE